MEFTHMHSDLSLCNSNSVCLQHYLNILFMSILRTAFILRHHDRITDTVINDLINDECAAARRRSQKK